jgi:hypothetical protein
MPNESPVQNEQPVWINEQPVWMAFLTSARAGIYLTLLFVAIHLIGLTHHSFWGTNSGLTGWSTAHRGTEREPG